MLICVTFMPCSDCFVLPKIGLKFGFWIYACLSLTLTQLAMNISFSFKTSPNSAEKLVPCFIVCSTVSWNFCKYIAFKTQQVHHLCESRSAIANFTFGLFQQKQQEIVPIKHKYAIVMGDTCLVSKSELGRSSGSFLAVFFNTQMTFPG